MSAERKPPRRSVALALLVAGAPGLVASAVALGAAAPKPGSLDSSFARTGVVTLGPGTRLFAVAVQHDGKVVAVGESGVGSAADVLVARFASSGALDRSFGHGGIARGPSLARGQHSLARAIAIQPDGRIVVVGSGTDKSGAYPDGLLVERFQTNGSLDPSFGSGGVQELLTGSQFGQGEAVALQRDGRILATGSATASGSGGVAPRLTVVRLNGNGTPDGSFAGHGTDVLDLGEDSTAAAVAIQRDGRIVVAGSQAPGGQVTNALVARLTASGALDHGFGHGGAYANQFAHRAAFSSFNAIAIEGNGKIVLAGAATAGLGKVAAQTFVARLTAAGKPDGSFGSGGVQYATSAINFLTSGGGLTPGAAAVAVSPSGELIAAGTSANEGSTALQLWAFSSRGAPDRSFGSGGSATIKLKSGLQSQAAAVAPDGAGKLVVAGEQNTIVGADHGLLARFVVPR